MRSFVKFQWLYKKIIDIQTGYWHHASPCFASSVHNPGHRVNMHVQCFQLNLRFQCQLPLSSSIHDDCDPSSLDNIFIAIVGTIVHYVQDIKCNCNEVILHILNLKMQGCLTFAYFSLFPAISECRAVALMRYEKKKACSFLFFLSSEIISHAEWKCSNSLFSY